MGMKRDLLIGIAAGIVVGGFSLAAILVGGSFLFMAKEEADRKDIYSRPPQDQAPPADRNKHYDVVLGKYQSQTQFLGDVRIIGQVTARKDDLALVREWIAVERRNGSHAYFKWDDVILITESAPSAGSAVSP